jgi:hypothetical protein
LEKYSYLENAFVTKNKPLTAALDEELANLQEAGVIANVKKKWILSQAVCLFLCSFRIRNYKNYHLLLACE